VRESSNAPQAATASAADTSVAPEAPAASRPKTPAVTAASTPAKAAETSSVIAKPVSITGCLLRDGDGFVLKDTEGTDAPKSRSWKSGFFRKKSAKIDLVDAGNAAGLGTHVGKRVSVTGPLADREMRVQSVRRIGATCG
jgi:hypothetical protein